MLLEYANPDGAKATESGVTAVPPAAAKEFDPEAVPPPVAREPAMTTDCAAASIASTAAAVTTSDVISQLLPSHAATMKAHCELAEPGNVTLA
jgi:hypothetical protein